jgi:hypothetical protein
MHEGPLVSRFAISTVLLLGLLFSHSAFAAAAGSQRANETGSMGPVPKAQCGPSNRTESGLQGQTTSQERASGDSQRGYNCNLEFWEQGLTQIPVSKALESQCLVNRVVVRSAFWRAQ